MTGHRIVGQVAANHLTPAARKAVKKILGNESLAMASNWPDFIKSDNRYNYLSPWHYINLPDKLQQDAFNHQLQKDTGTDAYTKLNFIISQLKDKNLPHDKQVFYLRLLVHIVGDVHQPMHVSREEDQGGNKIFVKWFNTPTNLHHVWDEDIVEYQKLSYTEYTNAIDHATAQQLNTWQHQPINTWFFESYNIAQNLYGEIKEDGQKLSYRYNFDHIDTVNQQLLKGGIRLAGLLNTIFK